MLPMVQGLKAFSVVDVVGFMMNPPFALQVEVDKGQQGDEKLHPLVHCKEGGQRHAERAQEQGTHIVDRSEIVSLRIARTRVSCVPSDSPLSHPQFRAQTGSTRPWPSC